MIRIPLVFGVVLMVFGSKFVLQAQATKSWQQTQGFISQVNLIASTSSTSTTSSKQKTIDISVVYRYQINGKDYQSDKYSYGDGKTAKSRLKNKITAQHWLENSPYQTGNEINIYYNPKNPQQAVIKTGASIWTFIPLLIGILLTVVFLIILWRIKR
jgi:hypothetical protein